MGRKSDPPVVLIKWYDFTKCACVDCSRPTRAKCESTSSGVEPLTGGRGIGIVASSTVPSQGLPDSPAHRRFCWWANHVMCGCGE
jgi:hypothetical protein